MEILRWEPFRGLEMWPGRLEPHFNGGLPALFKEAGSSTRTWSPVVDIYETDNNMVLKAELAGVDPKDVEARIEDGTLYLKGARKLENDVKQGSYHRIERSYGSFVRTFSLPATIDPDKVMADYKDGVLTLTLPKRDEAKPKAININVSKN